jgi:hypothetical protein
MVQYKYRVERRKANGYWEEKKKYPTKKAAEKFVMEKAESGSRVRLRVKKIR